MKQNTTPIDQDVANQHEKKDSVQKDLLETFRSSFTRAEILATRMEKKKLISFDTKKICRLLKKIAQEYDQNQIEFNAAMHEFYFKEKNNTQEFIDCQPTIITYKKEKKFNPEDSWVTHKESLN